MVNEPARRRQGIKAIETSPGVATHGAYAKDRLSACLVTCLHDGWLQILHQMSRLAALPLQPGEEIGDPPGSDIAAEERAPGTSREDDDRGRGISPCPPNAIVCLLGKSP